MPPAQAAARPLRSQTESRRRAGVELAPNQWTPSGEVIPGVESPLDDEEERDAQAAQPGVRADAVRLVESRGDRTVGDVAQSLGVAESCCIRGNAKQRRTLAGGDRGETRSRS